LRFGAFPIRSQPPVKKQRREVLPENRFDIFEHFFDEPEMDTPQAPFASSAGQPNGYAKMWFSGEAAPPPRVDNEAATKVSSSHDCVDDIRSSHVDVAPAANDLPLTSVKRKYVHIVAV